MHQIIGLTGYATVGKDSVGAVLVARGWVRVSFADNVRALALAADPLILIGAPHLHTQRLSTVVAAEGWDRAKARPEVRRFLQAIGSGVRDVLGDQTWIDAALDQADGFWGVAGVVVTDVRHSNEAAAIRDRGGVIVRVVRPGVGPANGHVSEVGVDDIAPDYRIANDGGLGDLGQQVDTMLFELAGGAEHGYR